MNKSFQCLSMYKVPFKVVEIITKPISVRLKDNKRIFYLIITVGTTKFRESLCAFY